MLPSFIGPTSFSFKGINWKKIGIGAAAVMVGALLTYITNFLTSTDFGTYTPVVVGVWTIIAHIGAKWVSDNE